jgi:hypothetical protein
MGVEEERAVLRIGVMGLIIGGALALNVAAASAVSTPLFSKLPTVKTFTSSEGTSKFVVVTRNNDFTLISCAEGTSTGEITGVAAVGRVVMKFTGCGGQLETKEGLEGCSIKSVGASEAEIIVKTLKGLLGTTAGAADLVGLLLQPETTKRFIEFANGPCVGESFITGSFAGEILPINTPQATAKLLFLRTSKGPKIETILVAGKAFEPELVYFSETIAAEADDELGFSGAIEVT